MRAAVLHDGRMVVRDGVPEPEPAFGQVLVEVAACGICGSDLHFARHGRTMLDRSREMTGMPAVMAQPEVDLARDVYMGHEFSARVLEAGPDTVAPPPGTLVTSIPVLLSETGIAPIVYSNTVHGGYAERMLLSAPMLIAVPTGVDPRHAALAEPMAVGLHAVNRSGITAGLGAVVLGCGPVGLAVIAALRLRGIEPIVASDFSPGRRRLAEQMGAHLTIDPRADEPFEAFARVGRGGVPVIFEAIGVPGIIDSALRAAPPRSKLVVVGVCMERDAITPFFGIAKEIDVHFCLAYDWDEFNASLRSIAEGAIDVRPLITGEVGIDGVPGAFDALADPEQHCKILVIP